MPPAKKTIALQDAHNVFSHFKRNYPIINIGKRQPWQILGASRLVWDHLDLVAALSENASECHSGCVNALTWSADGTVLLSGGDDTRVHIWKMSSSSSDIGYGLTCTAKIFTGHTNNIFSVQTLKNSNRIATCAADRQVRVFDINRGLSSDGMDEFRDKGCIRVFRCHRKRVKRIMAENSPDNFLSVAEDGTVRQHDLRTQHRCSPNRESCSAVLVRVPFELSTISMSSLTSYHFVVAGESPYAFLFDRRQVGRRIEEEWGVNLTSSEITTCVRRFGRRHTQLPPKSLYQDHITGSRLSQANGHELLLSYSGDAVYSFSTRDVPGETTPGLSLIPNNKDRGEGEEEDLTNELSPEGSGYDGGPLSQPTVYSRQKYLGACNIRTIKDVNFIGPQDEYVVSGSDDGNFFIWDKKTGDIVDIHEGDGGTVNVVEQHPFLPVLAVSGLDDTVKIFGPSYGLRKSSRLSMKDEIIRSNTSRASPFRRHRLELEELLLHFQEASAGGGIPENVECVYQ